MHTSMLFTDLMMTALADWQSEDKSKGAGEVLQESRMKDVLMEDVLIMARNKDSGRKAA